MDVRSDNLRTRALLQALGDRQIERLDHVPTVCLHRRFHGGHFVTPGGMLQADRAVNIAT
jgi:hypothetical protein